jgi:hypothetical protein
MTPEAQRIAIAELCGIVRILTKAEFLPAFIEWLEEERHPHAGLTRPSWIILLKGRRIPDYCNDLNAMHEAEQWLCSGQRENPFANADRYFHELAHVCNPSCDMSNESNQRPIFASAAQRAEAFLRTMGKLTDD